MDEIEGAAVASLGGQVSFTEGISRAHSVMIHILFGPLYSRLNL